MAGAPLGSKTDRDHQKIIWALVIRRPLKRQRREGGRLSVGVVYSAVAEHWQLKPEALGLIAGSTTFLPLSSLFQRSLDSNSPDYLPLYDIYQFWNLGEPHSSGFTSCDIATNSFNRYDGWLCSCD